jgi:hypothetical protein
VDFTKDVEILTGGSAPKGKVWIYVNVFKKGEPGEKSADAAGSHRGIVRGYLPDGLPAD